MDGVIPKATPDVSSDVDIVQAVQEPQQQSVAMTMELEPDTVATLVIEIEKLKFGEDGKMDGVISTATPEVSSDVDIVQAVPDPQQQSSSMGMELEPDIVTTLVTETEKLKFGEDGKMDGFLSKATPEVSSDVDIVQAVPDPQQQSSSMGMELEPDIVTTLVTETEQLKFGGYGKMDGVIPKATPDVSSDVDIVQAVQEPQQQSVAMTMELEPDTVATLVIEIEKLKFGEDGKMDGVISTATPEVSSDVDIVQAVPEPQQQSAAMGMELEPNIVTTLVTETENLKFGEDGKMDEVISSATPEALSDVDIVQAVPEPQQQSVAMGMELEPDIVTTLVTETEKLKFGDDGMMDEVISSATPEALSDVDIVQAVPEPQQQSVAMGMELEPDIVTTLVTETEKLKGQDGKMDEVISTATPEASSDVDIVQAVPEPQQQSLSMGMELEPEIVTTLVTETEKLKFGEDGKMDGFLSKATPEVSSDVDIVQAVPDPQQQSSSMGMELEPDIVTTLVTETEKLKFGDDGMMDEVISTATPEESSDVDIVQAVPEPQQQTVALGMDLEANIVTTLVTETEKLEFGGYGKMDEVISTATPEVSSDVDIVQAVLEPQQQSVTMELEPDMDIVSALATEGWIIMPLVNNSGSSSEAPSQEYEFCNGEIQWCFSQVKGALDDDVTEADIISCVEFNDDGEFLATGDKGGRVVIFQRDALSKNCIPRRGEYNVYSTFQSHEPEFDYLKSLEIEEKINKIRWLRRKNPAHFLLSTNDKTIKLWKVAEKTWKIDNFNLKEDCGSFRDPTSINTLQVPRVSHSQLSVEASLRRVFANAHTYHINSISVNSDQETYLSADDLRINLWNLEITDQSFNIVDIKPTNMEELTEVITASEFHPSSCNLFVYSSSKGTIRLCDMRAAALCDRHTKLFDEPEDPTNRSFFSEIISSISDVKFSYSGRYMVSRDYLSIKVWDLHMESRPIECYPVHEYLRSKLCSLYENDCIFDKFECCWNGTDTAIMTGSYNNFFRMFDRNLKKEYTLEASRDVAKPKTVLKPRKVGTTPKRKKDEIGVDCLDFSKKILHTAWHPKENIIAVAATNNLFLFQDKC